MTGTYSLLERVVSLQILHTGRSLYRLYINTDHLTLDISQYTVCVVQYTQRRAQNFSLRTETEWIKIETKGLEQGWGS